MNEVCSQLGADIRAPTRPEMVRRCSVSVAGRESKPKWTKVEMGNNTLSRQVMLSISAVTLAALAVAFFGGLFYLYNYDWFFPEVPIQTAQDEEVVWEPSDFVVLATFVAFGLITAGIVGWRLARRIIRPLEAVATALRSITAGDFSARAQIEQKGFGETETLIEDFNAMAWRLETAEAELRFSNSAIAHELRTPLTILRGRLQGLADGAFAPTPELFRNLIAHVDGLSHLVEDLRALGLASAGHLDLRLEEIDLAREVRTTAEAIETEMAIAGLKIEYNLSMVHCLADRNRIRQAVLAILDNARRYAPNSRVRLETFTDGPVGTIRCADNGPGLPPGNPEKVFERFWRAEQSRSRSSGGSGLGLSVVRAIARAHGGDATASNSPGNGFSIDITLPLPAPKQANSQP